MTEPKPVDVWKLADLCTPWCVHVAATLRVPDLVAAGTSELHELAAAAGADAEALGRVLRHLVGAGVFEEPAPGRFALNEPARALMGPGARLGFDLDGFGGRMAHAWGGLLATVRTGRPAYATVFGREFWDDLAAHPELSESFDALMGPDGHGLPDPEVLIAGEWEAVRTVVDVGGGTGGLLAEILRVHPSVRGVLVDLPSTVARSRARFEAAGVAERVTAAPQSFFEPLPAGADLYLLKSVLADWPDREAQEILRGCSAAAQPAGRVVVLNGVTPDEDGPAPPELLMLVLVGGKARTLAELRALASPVGLEVHAAVRQASGRFVVELRPR
jgi:SAM-dependent methyltransferase